MIINKEEVEKAALEYIKDIHAMYHVVGCDCFIEGAKFVENKVQEYVVDIITENQGLKLYKDNESERFKNLAVEFGEYLQGYENSIYNISIIYNEFIKERNETNS